MTEYKLYCGDNVQVMKDYIKDESVDMILTSPPYDDMDEDFNPIPKGLREYEGYSWDFKSLVHESYRVLKPGGVIVWVVADPTIDGSESLASSLQKIYFRKAGFNIHDTMIYEIAGTGAKGSNYAYWQTWEYMFILSKGKPKTVNRIADVLNSGRGQKRGKGKKAGNLKSRQERKGIIGKTHSIRSNIWRYAVGLNSDKTKFHPAPFPEKLAHDHILTWSNPGDIVLDTFCGSGTTIEQAYILDRDSIGIDSSQKYIDEIAIDRMKFTDPKLYLADSKQLTLEI